MSHMYTYSKVLRQALYGCILNHTKEYIYIYIHMYISILTRKHFSYFYAEKYQINKRSTWDRDANLKKIRFIKSSYKKCTIKIHETFKKIKKIQEDLKKR